CVAAGLVIRLSLSDLPGYEFFIEPEMEYRGVLVQRRPDMSGQVADTDPQVVGVEPLQSQPLVPEAARTAELAAEFVRQARALLRDEPRASGLLLRGFATQPRLPGVGELYQLDAAAVAIYPMYRGLARLVGMTILPTGA